MNQTLEYENSESIDSQRLRLGEFVADSLRRVSGAYLVWLLLAAMFGIGVYYVWRGSPMAGLYPAQFLYYFIVTVHVIFRFRHAGRASILAPDIIFVFFYTLFHLGFVSMYSLGVVPYSTYIFHYDASIPKAMLIVTLGLVGFIFGYEIIGLAGRGPARASIIVPTQGWASLGMALMAIAIVMHLSGLVMLGFDLISRYGYMAIQGAERFASYFTVLILSQSITVMVLGLVLYLVTSALRTGRLFDSKFALGLTAVFFVLMAMEGDRGPIMKMGVPILLVRHYFIKRIRIRYLACLFVGVLVFFAGTAVVRQIVFQPARMLEEYRYQKEAGAVEWYSAFAEMGSSFMVVDIVANDIPSQEPYWKGASWVNAAAHAVPFLQGLLMRIGILTTPSPSVWVTYTYFGYGAAGRGFTVAAEGYLNFGLAGAFGELMLFGLFIRWLTIKFSRRVSAVWALIMFGCLEPSIMVIRNHVNLVTNVYVLVFLLAGFLNLFLRNEQEYELGVFEPSDFVYEAEPD